MFVGHWIFLREKQVCLRNQLAGLVPMKDRCYPGIIIPGGITCPGFLQQFKQFVWKEFIQDTIKLYHKKVCLWHAL
jgi:hypothetical protein